MSESNKKVNKVDRDLRILSNVTNGMYIGIPKLMDKLTDAKMAELNNTYTMMLNYSPSALLTSDKKQKEISNFISKLKDPASTSADTTNTKTNTYPDIESDLRDIHSYKKKFYSLLSDYEIMPQLVPALIRVLNFLVTDTVSPDAQNPGLSFSIKCKDKAVLEEINSIRKEHGLDTMLTDIVEKRYRVGTNIRMVQGYNTLFTMVSQLMASGDGRLNESLMETSINQVESVLRDVADRNISTSLNAKMNEAFSNDPNDKLDINIAEMGISIEYGSVCRDYADRINAMNVALNEASKYSSKNILNGNREVYNFGEYILAESILVANPGLADEIGDRDILNEAVISKINEEVASILNENVFQSRSSLKAGVSGDAEKIAKLVKKLAKDDNVRRSSTRELDPARTFMLKAGGRTIGCFEYTDDQTENKKDFIKLISKTVRNSKIGKDAYQFAEEEIARKTAEAMINSIKADLNLNTFEEVDLFYDYLNQSSIVKGNKKFKFYHADDIFDFSRGKGSLFVNAVYIIKMLAFLKHNNITTKIAKGRDREVFYVNMGASPAVRTYLNGAMETLASNNDGVYRAINGPMNRILNPYQNSTIVIPVEDGADKFINADIINGQNVDMDDDLITFLTKEAIVACDTDPAIIDMTTNNVDFAKSLSMVSKERSSKTVQEQSEINPVWERMVLKVLYESGSDQLRTAVDNGDIKVTMFTPKSLLLDIVQNEINNARSFAEMLVEMHPLLANIKEEDEITKPLAIYEIVREFVSESLDKYDPIIEEAISIGYAKYATRLDELNEIRNAEEKPKKVSGDFHDDY